MTKKPLVSIITPLYNSERHIGDNIESVLKQEYENFEMIIIDDKSTDNGIKIVEQYLEMDDRIKLLKNKNNLGGAKTRNKGIEKARGEYIAFLDSDDLWEKNKLEIQIKFMEENNYSFSFSEYERVNENGESLYEKVIVPEKINYNSLLRGNVIGCLTAVYNQKKLGKVYFPEILVGQDFALWLEMLKKVDYAYGIKKPLAKYRLRENSLSSNKKKRIKGNWEIFRKHNEIGLFKSVWYLSNNIIDKVFRLRIKKISKYKVGICGHFGIGKNLLNGQTIKTKTVTEEITKKIGEENIKIVDTYAWRKTPLNLIANCISLIKESENILIFPAYKGVKVFIPLFNHLNKLYKKKIHYIVIGGWLHEYLDKNNYLKKYLKKLSGIYVETNFMKKKLDEFQWDNIYVMNNFKNLKKRVINEIHIDFRKKFKFCNFSRIMEEKGITDSINLIKRLNEKGYECSLDIYGQIEKKYEEKFNKLLLENKGIITYMGSVDANNSVEVLSEYDCLLFLTYFSGEGFPGTLLDALFSGIPVIGTKWKYNEEIIKDGETGFLCEVGNIKELDEKAICLMKDKPLRRKISLNALKHSDNFKGEEIINILVDRL